MRTLREWLKHGEAQLLSGPHPQKARLDAESLMLGLVQKNRAWLMTHLDDELSSGDADLYIQTLEARAAGEPIQYIQKMAEFYGYPFIVTRDVLIPRPETEHLVEEAILQMQSAIKPGIVDVGTGSGAIAIALAKHLIDARITAIDLSQATLDIAQLNARQNEVQQRIRFLQGDLLAPVAGEQFELIVSNPPYVPITDRATLSVEVREFEPALALFAGNDGLDIYRRLIPDAQDALVPGGWLLLEIGYGQSEAIAALLADAGYTEIGFTQDLQGIARVASACRP